MVSLNDELVKFQPVDLKSLEEINVNISDKVRNSIILYNKAIENIKAHNEDIAVIELKKAISLNPDFYEAMNLLGLCYQYTKEYDKAQELFKKVVAAESNSVQALEYMKALEGGNQIESKNSVKSSVNKAAKPVKPEVQPKQMQKMQNKKEIKTVTKSDTTINNIFQYDITKYLLGFAAGILILFLVQLPFRKDDEVSSAKGELNTPAPTVVMQNEFEAKYNALNEEYQKLQKEFEKAKTELTYYTSTSKLSDAERLYSERKYEEAADLLVLIRSIEFKGAEKEKYDKLASDIIPRATWAVYLQGDNLFNSQNYKDAAAKYVKVQSYGGDWDYMPIAYYNLGRSYIALNDKAKALESFKKLKELFPNSEYSRYADSRIKEIGG